MFLNVCFFQLWFMFICFLSCVCVFALCCVFQCFIVCVLCVQFVVFPFSYVCVVCWCVFEVRVFVAVSVVLVLFLLCVWCSCFRFFSVCVSLQGLFVFENMCFFLVLGGRVCYVRFDLTYAC